MNHQLFVISENIIKFILFFILRFVCLRTDRVNTYCCALKDKQKTFEKQTSKFTNKRICANILGNETQYLLSGLIVFNTK